MLIATKQPQTAISTLDRLTDTFGLTLGVDPVKLPDSKAGNIAIRSLAKRLVDINCSAIPLYPVGYGDDKDKTPRLKEWIPYQQRCMDHSEIDSYTWDAIGLVTGFQNIEAIDYDNKNEIDGPSLSQFKRIVSEQAPGLLSRLFVQRTVSGGLHFVYRCKEVSGNQKLAESSNKATIWETRGKGGYIVLAPSPGYQVLQSSFPLPWITPEERTILFSAARSLNKYEESEAAMKARVEKLSKAVSKNADHKPNQETKYDSFGWFQKNADIGKMLTANGWQHKFDSHDREYFVRPGKAGGKGYSANVLNGVLKVHSTSTGFDTSPGVAYNAVQVYCKLYCNDDMSAAASAIHAMMRKGGIQL